MTGLKGRFRTEEMIVVKDVFAMDDYIHKSLSALINQFVWDEVWDDEKPIFLIELSLLPG